MDYRHKLYTSIIKVNVETKKANREKKKIKSARGTSRDKTKSKPKKSNSGGSTTKKKKSNE